MAAKNKKTKPQESHSRRMVQMMADPSYPETHFIQLAAIWHVIAETMSVDLSVVAHNCRAASYVTPRHMFYYMARKYTQASYAEIGQYAGGRDHSSVINGHNRILDLMAYEKKTRELVELIDRNLTGRVPADEDPELKIRAYPAWMGFIG